MVFVVAFFGYIVGVASVGTFSSLGLLLAFVRFFPAIAWLIVPIVSIVVTVLEIDAIAIVASLVIRKRRVVGFTLGFLFFLAITGECMRRSRGP